MTEAQPAAPGMPHWLTGVLPVLPTPFSPRDEVDYAALPGLIDFACASGVKTVVTPAFGSEFYKLEGSERQRVIETVLTHAARKDVRVVVQCNHTTPRVAARLAAEAKTLGAAAVATALPRAFASSETQLLDYARQVCEAAELPVIIQDWNPGGRSAGTGFFAELHSRCRNFKMAKLEEPGVGETIRTITSETGGDVGVLSGWGGSYAIQLHGAGLAGIMPGLALADVFVRIWELLRSANKSGALHVFEEISPYLQFSLQTFEQFHHAEKRLLVRRGLLQCPHVRSVTVELDTDTSAYLGLLIDQLQEHL